MSLVLGAGAYCNWNKILPVLTALGYNEGQARKHGSELTQEMLAWVLSNEQSVAVDSIKQIQLLSEKIEHYPNQRVVLFYSDLADILIHALSTEQNMTNVLALWKRSLTVLQDFYRKHRKQTLLFNLRDVLIQPQLFLEVCAKEWSCTVADVDLKSNYTEPETWSKYLAHQLLNHDYELNQVFQHTKVMTWPLDVSEPSEYDTNIGIVSLLQRLQNNFSLQKDSCLLVEEKDELEQHKLKLTAENQTLLERLSALDSEYKQSQKQFKLFEATLSEENKLLTDKTFVQQEELEKNIVDLEAGKKELATLRLSYTQLESTRGELNATVNDLTSKLEQLQQQLALSKKTFTDLQAAKQKLYDENKLILEQMFVQQEELEKNIVDLEARQKELVVLRLNCTQLESARGELNATVSDLRSELKESEEQSKLSEKALLQLQADKKELTNKNQLIDEQISGAQAELEKRILEVQLRSRLG